MTIENAMRQKKRYTKKSRWITNKNIHKQKKTRKNWVQQELQWIIQSEKEKLRAFSGIKEDSCG